VPGGTVSFHVSTQSGERYRISVYRLGWYGGVGARLFTCLPACDGDHSGSPQQASAPDPSSGEAVAHWPVTDTLAVGGDWPSGYYLADVTLTTGAGAGSAYPTVFVVREAGQQHSAFLVQVPVNTWAAYNNWGGKSLYGFSSTGGVAANRVSFERPFAWAGFGAPAPFVWELQLVRFLEREGYDVAYQTDADTDADPATLLAHRAVITAGHGEYWTMRMRDAFEAARDAGTNLAFMGANTGYWQVRYEDSGQTLVGYKSLGDPYPDAVLRTALFRDVGRPECALLGVEHLGGRGVADYAVTTAGAADPWLAGTGLVAGSTLPGLVGAEFDGIPPVVPGECAKPALVDLFHYDGPFGLADAVRYTAPSGARVFASGTAQFSWSLDDFSVTGRGAQSDPRLQQFVRQMLDDLGRPAPPTVRVTRRRRGGVFVRTRLAGDPRVAGVQVYRVTAQGARVLLCTRPLCVDRSPAARYEAVAVDPWGTSVPASASR
jgi:hypothetical protein